jgi:type I restriction enzyme S subunit
VARHGWHRLALGEFLTESRQRVAVNPNDIYPMCGVYGFGRGVLFRDAVRGADMSTPYLYRISAGQIIYSRLKAFEGAFALVPREAEGRYVSNEFPTFDVDESQAVPAFIAHMLARPRTWTELTERITGVGARRERLQVQEFLEFEIELPPPAAQRSVVMAVTAADAAVTASGAERHAGFEMLRAAVEALIVPLGRWDTLPQGWQLRELGDVAELRSGITKGRRTAEPLEPVPFLRAANVQGGYLDLTEIKTIEVTAKEKERFRLERGDVLMIEGGNAEHLGRGWVWSGEVEGCLHQNHVFRARPNTTVAEPRFLAYVMAASPARAYCLDKAKRTTNLASINSTQIRALPVPLPARAEQREIVAKLDAIRSAAIAAQHAHERLRELRSTLVEVLLSGDWHVPGPVSQLATA